MAVGLQHLGPLLRECINAERRAHPDGPLAKFIDAWALAMWEATKDGGPDTEKRLRQVLAAGTCALNNDIQTAMNGKAAVLLKPEDLE